MALLLAGCSDDGSDAGTTTTTAADAPAPDESTTTEAMADETTVVDDAETEGDEASSMSPRELCEASADTADLASRQALLDALQQAYFDVELKTDLEPGETYSLLSCEGDRAELLQRVGDGVPFLIVFEVTDDAFVVDAAKEPGAACDDPDLSESAASALAC
ncbi:MAG: hypothetical protein R2711_01750 [Acidimicrobiales bacterium]